jgi:hypothetical protein
MCSAASVLERHYATSGCEAIDNRIMLLNIMLIGDAWFLKPDAQRKRGAFVGVGS